MEEVLHTLRQSLRHGYCLHGSKLELKVIEPRQAVDVSGKPEGCLKAVYATRHEIIPAIVMASRSGDGDITFQGVSDIWSVMPHDPSITLSPGHVHILPSSTFQEVGTEWVSFVPVRPVAVMRITPSIWWLILAEGNVDLRIPIPEPW